MFWVFILTLLGGAIWIVVVLLGAPCFDKQCSVGNDSSTEHDIEMPSLLETASECHQALQSLEEQKLQLHNRLAMLDEMIEKSDREIIRMQEQLGRMNIISSTQLTETDYDMLNLLNAGGYDAAEIARLTHLNIEDLDQSA